MGELLWTFKDVTQFIDHPDQSLRLWALERLLKRFPNQAASPLAAMLEDPYPYIALKAAEFIAKTGDLEYGSLLLNRFQHAHAPYKGYMALALARLDYREALPHILEHLEVIWQEQTALDANEFLYLVESLGLFGGEEARRRLWQILPHFARDDFFGGTISQAVLKASQPKDVIRLVESYRSWPVGPRPSRHLDSFAVVAGAGRLLQEIRSVIDKGLDAALERATWWLGREPELSKECVTSLSTAFGHRHEGVFDVLLAEARRLTEERLDDIAGWQTKWEAGEQPAGYHRRALLTLSILEAFAAHPNQHPEQRRHETALGLALLCQLSIDRDDQARLEAAEDKIEILLTVLTEDREHALPDIVERVTDLGPEIVPQLVARFDPHSPGWGMIRIAEAIEHLAYRHPGSCDAAIPELIEALNDQQGDYLHEACAGALEAIGLAAVKPIIAHLRDDDLARQIFLTGVLGEIPTEDAAQALLDLLKDDRYPDEMHVNALTDIGSPSAIEPLYALSQAEHHRNQLLAESLLVLCQLNNVQKPELPQWRKIVRAEEIRLSRLSRGETAAIEKDEPIVQMAPPPSPSPPSKKQPKQRSRRKPRSVSKAERKKRSAQRKRQKRGRK